ncbi:hypothetical protein GR173_001170 [Salmonella enterica subsp. enterica]|uniref:Uncharacterized protein n=1 Tax=Salmonella enterica subsp. enterica serovar Mapo TaxID=2564752 RepID=A0A5H7IMH6_SALET|nr:hypothetical protein [Salmonella enterica subsp. enterica serovar Mapo]EDU0167802.1 hypothetical protein [Salmonella enterica subsp. enterica serovar Belfast]EDX9677732.1 hypothetical protein [Salmonella enterica subsp. enterica serovar Belfast]EDY5453668.1 hypothetical protein [Salmonella enterica subsp. enterica serovar Belfast]
MKGGINIVELAAICYAGVAALREATGEGDQPEWVDLEPDKQGVITDYITQLLTGQPIPDSYEVEVIRRIIAVIRDEKKTLKYA